MLGEHQQGDRCVWILIIHKSIILMICLEDLTITIYYTQRYVVVTHLMITYHYFKIRYHYIVIIEIEMYSFNVCYRGSTNGSQN